ncbi:MAG: RES family NAD+ phosphorylase [Chloroflexota bacterium]
MKDADPPAPVSRHALPEPSAGLHAVALPIHDIASQDWGFHQCFRADRGPLYLGYSDRGRFNAPSREFGVTYVSEIVEDAFVETFLHNSPTDPLVIRVITREHLARRQLCRIVANPRHPALRPLRLVDLTGNGAVLIGATGELATATHIEQQPSVRRWALALHRHPAQPDGIVYPARHDLSQRSLALFDRPTPMLAAEPGNRLDDEAVLAALFGRYRVAFVDGQALPPAR